MLRGPPQGYFTDPTKSILVVSPRNVPRAETFFCGYRLEIVTGGIYLGGFVGTEVAQDWRIEEKVEGWNYLVDIMPGVA